jgi:amino acid adenylation domain-containing protein
MLQQQRLLQVSDEEQRRILTQWNQTKRDYPQDKTMHQLFEGQVVKTPNNIAVIFKDQQLTYLELNTKANQLAHYLREQGVGPEVFVAIAVERSLEMIVGILGVLKAGGTYVPIDPSYPQERIQFMLEDTNAQLFLTQQDLLGRLARTAAEVFLLDKDQEELKSHSESNPRCVAKPHHLAYVIYTSGTTGRPKGVLIEHKGVCARLAFWQTNDPLEKDDVFLHQASISFDASVEELFWPLTNGFPVVIAPSTQYSHLDNLRTLISSHKVTFLQCTPSLLKMLLEHPNLEQLHSLRKVFLSGEALPHSLKDEFFKKLPEAELKNVYGITETTVDTMIFSCKPSEKPYSSQFVPIGRPISNLQAYILDTVLNLVPIGAVGELHIGGDGLARGYLNRPDLTAEKFIENPFQTEGEKRHGENARLYKTGDLCRWLEDGNVEYVGRLDSQVKIRGFRIELGEIEAILLQHIQIKEAVVIAREDASGDKKLVGYLVLKKHKNQRTIETAELRNYLSTYLPDYMIPSVFVTLEVIPLTPNGKVDRKGLPAPGYQENQRAYATPRTAIEKALCEIWQNILNIESIGIYDNFFILGGHSLLATQAMSRLRSQYGIEISFTDFFESADIATLAQTIEMQKKKTKIENKILPLISIQRKKEHFL